MNNIPNQVCFLRYLALACVIICLFSISACKDSEHTENRVFQSENREIFKQGDLAPDFKLELVEGLTNRGIIEDNKNKKNLFELLNKPILINFWASWCVPCVKEMNSLVELEKKLEGKLKVVFINADSKSSFAEAIKVINDNSIIGPVFFDPELYTIEQYSVSGFPETFFLNKSGKFNYILDPNRKEQVIRVKGERNWSAQVVIDYFNDVLTKMENSSLDS